MTRYTQGPWVVTDDPNIAPEKLPEGYPIPQSVFSNVPGAINAEIAGNICEPANAKLVAAAPELFEQLARIIKAHDANSGNEPSVSVLEREIDMAQLLLDTKRITQ